MPYRNERIRGTANGTRQRDIERSFDRGVEEMALIYVALDQVKTLTLPEVLSNFSTRQESFVATLRAAFRDSGGFLDRRLDSLAGEYIQLCVFVDKAYQMSQDNNKPIAKHHHEKMEQFFYGTDLCYFQFEDEDKPFFWESVPENEQDAAQQLDIKARQLAGVSLTKDNRPLYLEDKLTKIEKSSATVKTNVLPMALGLEQWTDSSDNENTQALLDAELASCFVALDSFKKLPEAHQYSTRIQIIEARLQVYEYLSRGNFEEIKQMSEHHQDIVDEVVIKLINRGKTSFGHYAQNLKPDSRKPLYTPSHAAQCAAQCLVVLARAFNCLDRKELQPKFDNYKKGISKSLKNLPENFVEILTSANPHLATEYVASLAAIFQNE